MCGRYTVIHLGDFIEVFNWIDRADPMPPARYNVAPMQLAPVVAADVKPKIDLFKWGLVPRWAKDIAIGNRMINARSETLSEKPAFKGLLKRKRCIIPADGFYEWKTDGKLKTPMYIHRKDKKPFALAGLWDAWHAADGSELRTFTIITTSPNELMEKIHDRMPVMFDERSARKWLNPELDDPRELSDLLQPFDASKLSADEVSRAVNSPKNDSPELVEPVKESDSPKKKSKEDQPSLFAD